MLGDAALTLHHVEQGRGAYIGLGNAGGAALLQAAGNVFVEAATGDVGNSLDRDFVHNGQNGLDIDAGGGQQGLAKGLIHAVKGLFQHIGVVVNVENLANQRETVGMHTGGGQRNNDVARLHRGVVQNLGLVHHADSEACQVVLIFRHHAGVFGSLAAHQGAARLHAALGHALDDLGNLLGDILAAGNVVKENQGLRACTDHVIDAHGNAVDADGVVLVQQHGDTQLGADAVGAGNQNRMLHAGAVQLKQAAEAAQTADTVLGHRAGHVLFHQLHRAVTGGDIYTGRSIAGRIAFFHLEILTISYSGSTRSMACRRRYPWSRWAG